MDENEKNESEEAALGAVLMMADEMTKMNSNFLKVGRLTALATVLAAIIIRSGMSRK